MKRWLKWGAIALVVMLLALGVLRALSNRSAQQKSLTAPVAQSVVELAATDVVRVQSRELSQGLAISGALKAINSAVVKARVAGELQGLLVREGDSVQAGQVLAKVDPTEYLARLRQAQEQADAAKSQIEIAQRQYDNNNALVNQGFISKTALDTSASTLLGAQATYKAALAAMDVAKKAVDDCVLRAPLSGQVSQRLAQPGERVSVDARIVEVLDLSSMEVEAVLSAAESVNVQVGQQALLKIEGTPQAVTARVVRVSPSTQVGNRSVLAYLRIEKPVGLRQGLFAEGSLNIGHGSGLVVPLNTVRTDKPAPYVQVVENNVVVHKPVSTGIRGEADGQALVVIQGLPENTVVISGLLGTLREGTQVRFTASNNAPATAPAAAAK